MATFSYNQVKIAVDRAEKAATTYLNVASLQTDLTAAEFNEIKTLKRRIDDHLNITTEQFRGEDGISVEAIEFDQDTNRITVQYSDGSNTTYPDLDIPTILSIINYTVDNGNLIEHYNDSTFSDRGTLVGGDGIGIESVEVLEDGDIEFTRTDGSTYTIGNVDNFGENPITAVTVTDGSLYIQVRGVWVPEPVGVVRGEPGAPGILPQENPSTQVMVDWDGEKVTLTIPRDSGAPIVLDNVPFVHQVANPSDVLGLEWNNGENVVFTLITGARHELGSFNGKDGKDGKDGKSPTSTLGEPRYIKVSGVWRDEIPGSNENTNPSYRRMHFSDSDFDLGAGYPTLRYIAPSPVNKASISTRNWNEPVYSLRGVYNDVYSSDVSVKETNINANGELEIVIEFKDESDNTLSQTIGVGRVVGTDGTSITDINIETNGDIVVRYNNRPLRVIGNIKYDRIASAELNPITGRIQITTVGGVTVQTTATDIHGTDGVTRAPMSIFTEYFDSNGDLQDGTLEMIWNDDQGNRQTIGVIRPLQDHDVKLEEGNLLIRLAGEEFYNDLGRITGISSERDVTRVIFDGSSLQLEINGSEIEDVLGAIESFDGIEYDHATSTITFARGLREYPLVYARPDDGEHGRVIDSWTVENTTGNRELTVTLSDGSSPISGVEIDSGWINGFELTEDEEVFVTYTDAYNNDNTVKLGDAGGWAAKDGDFPAYIGIENLELWVRNWTDGRPDQNLGQVEAKWVSELFLDEISRKIKYRYDYEDAGTYHELTADLDGENAVLITSMEINEDRELIITLSNGSSINVGGIDGADARYITSFDRTGDVFTVGFSDGSSKNLNLDSFDGDMPRWIESFTINEDRKFEVVYVSSDHDLNEIVDPNPTIIGNADGEDAKYVVEFERDGDNFTARWNDDSITTVGSIEGFDGEDGDFITGITIDGNRLVASWYEKEDEILSDNIHFDFQVEDIRLDEDGHIVVEQTSNSFVTGFTATHRIEDVYQANDVAFIKTNYGDDIEVGYVAGHDYPDGTSIVRMYVEDEKLKFDLSDETTIEAGDYVRRSVVNVYLSGANNNRLVVEYSDGTTDDLGNVRGESTNLNIVDAFINQNYDLIITLDDPQSPGALDPIVVPNVRGEDGNGIKLANIVDGELVFTLDDDTEINLGNIQLDFGFAPWNPERVYNTAETMTLNGVIYMAQRDGVDSSPLDSPDDWTRVRLEGDPQPDAGRPTPIYPFDEEEGNLRPHLIGGGFRNYFSPDILDKREFQIDLASGNFSSPLYTAQENRLDHQVEMELEPGVEYKWRIRDFVKGTGYVTTWSISAPFTVALGSIERPSVGVNGGSTDVDIRGEFFSSAYVGNDTHVSSDWQVVTAEDGFIVYESLGDTVDKTELILPWGLLKVDTEYKIRVRHNSYTIRSEWSEWTEFKTRVRFESIQIKPVIAFVGADINATVAKPAFSVNSGISEFWDTYMGRHDVQALWEVRDSNEALVWSASTGVDILDMKVGRVLESGSTYSIRVKYQSPVFVGDSLWSDPISFTPLWSLGDVELSFVSLVDDVASFEISPFNGDNDEYRMTVWQVFNGNDEVIIEGECDETSATIDLAGVNLKDGGYIRVAHIARNAGYVYSNIIESGEIWGISKPVVSYDGDVNDASFFATFDFTPFESDATTHSKTYWKIEDADGNLIDSGEISGESILSFDYVFSGSDRDKDFNIFVRYEGEKALGPWSDPLNIRLIDNGYLLESGGILMLMSGGVLLNNDPVW